MLPGPVIDAIRPRLRGQVKCSDVVTALVYKVVSDSLCEVGWWWRECCCAQLPW